MTNFYLAMYHFKIKINKGEYLKLNEIPVTEKYRKNNSKYITFHELCNIIFKENVNKFIYEDLKVCKVEEPEIPFFHASLGLGESGNKRGLHDGKEDIELTPLKPTDIVVEPFFCMFCTPYENNNKTGFLVIEKKKSKPMIKIFKKMIINQLKEINDELRIIFENHIPHELNQIITDGTVKEYIFTVYENEKDEFDKKNLSKMKFIIPAIEKVSPINVEEDGIISRVKNFLKNIVHDDKFQMKVKYGDKQEVTLDIGDVFNPRSFYLMINEDIDTVNDNPTYESMVRASEMYIKSNFRYYVDNDDKSMLE